MLGKKYRLCGACGSKCEVLYAKNTASGRTVESTMSILVFFGSYSKLSMETYFVPRAKHSLGQVLKSLYLLIYHEVLR